MLNYEAIPKPYHPIARGISLLKDPEINSVIIKGKKGLGKSYWVDHSVKELGLDFVLFKGSVSEARFFEFIQKNKDKTIIMRDCGSLLRRVSFLDFLKSATDLIPVRKISRLNYAKHAGVDEEIDFTGNLVWEINSIPKRNKEDLDAVIDRSIFIEINPSVKEIKKIMLDICKTTLEKEITDYLYDKIKKIGLNNLNFRNQKKCLQIAKLSVEDKLNWKKQLDLFLDIQVSDLRKSLYRFAGYNRVRRMEFVKYFMQDYGVSYVTAQKRISEAIELGDLFSNGLIRQAKICLNKI